MKGDDILRAHYRADRELLETNDIPTPCVIVGSVHLDGTTLTYQTISTATENLSQAVKIKPCDEGTIATWKTAVSDESARRHTAALATIYPTT